MKILALVWITIGVLVGIYGMRVQYQETGEICLSDVICFFLMLGIGPVVGVVGLSIWLEEHANEIVIYKAKK